MLCIALSILPGLNKSEIKSGNLLPSLMLVIFSGVPVVTSVLLLAHARRALTFIPVSAAHSPLIVVDWRESLHQIPLCLALPGQILFYSGRIPIVVLSDVYSFG